MPNKDKTIKLKDLIIVLRHALYSLYLWIHNFKLYKQLSSFLQIYHK